MRTSALDVRSTPEDVPTTPDKVAQAPVRSTKPYACRWPTKSLRYQAVEKMLIAPVFPKAGDLALPW